MHTCVHTYCEGLQIYVKNFLLNSHKTICQIKQYISEPPSLPPPHKCTHGVPHTPQLSFVP